MHAKKRLSETKARHVETGIDFQGYEIHIGQTAGPDCTRPFADVSGRSEGAVSADRRVMGSYLHGMFRDDLFRRSFLSRLGVKASTFSYESTVETTLDRLAGHLEEHLDIPGLLGLASSPR